MNKPSTTAAAEPPVRRSSYDYDDLIRCGHGEYFGKDNGRMPLPNMLMLDRIALITSDTGKYGKGEIKAELDSTLSTRCSETTVSKVVRPVTSALRGDIR